MLQPKSKGPRTRRANSVRSGLQASVLGTQEKLTFQFKPESRKRLVSSSSYEARVPLRLLVLFRSSTDWTGLTHVRE